MPPKRKTKKQAGDGVISSLISLFSKPIVKSLVKKAAIAGVTAGAKAGVKKIAGSGAKRGKGLNTAGRGLKLAGQGKKKKKK